MICAREFADWLRTRFEQESGGITMTREDVNQLTGRQSFSMGFVNDVHYELMQHGMAFVTDMGRETFYLIPISDALPWRERLEYQYEKELFCNIYPMEKSG
ncbi:hypothetical protein VPR01S_18_00030 [Vibrio proteolyticus NBRC 13287]|uniref:Uncharacterized protein n=2 Tax=Vibrionaceae TaxID=641 RepID=U2ZLF5_VIBPR|nr:hypothetical protein VPR01S_18_00030 [Vibrio proteolyticus NBRC 13287]